MIYQIQKKIIIASNNKYKINEIKLILNQYTNIKIIILKDELLKEYQAEENGTTFKENSNIKALSLLTLINKHNINIKDIYILSDDSGLEVKILNNQPGIYSSRYSNFDNPLNLNNINKLLYKLSNCPERQAKFTCAITICSYIGNLKNYIGEIKGKITKKQVKNTKYCFDYDSIFIPNNYNKTLAELSINVKNNISHRYNAIKQALKDIKNW